MTRFFQTATYRFFRNEGLKTLVSCFLLTGCFSQKSVIGNKIVLKVNQTEVSAQEFADKLARELKGFDALHAKDETNLKRAKEQTVQKFVFAGIVRDFAAKNKIVVADEELEAEILKIRSKYPDDNAFRRALADENVSLDEWRKELAFTLLQKKILAFLNKGMVAPTETEMKAYYEANRKLFEKPARIQLRQVVLETEDNAKRILDEINAGKNFAELAKKFSVAPEGERGGVTDWIEKGSLEVFDGAFRLNVGARSKVVRSPYGYHIYEVLKKEPEGRLPYEQAKDKIRTLITERKEQVTFTAWLEEQVRTVSVHRNDALIKAIQVTTRGT